MCSGKHDVRGLRRPPGRQSELVGFKLHFRLTPAQQAELGSSVELFLFCGGYGGLAPIEDGLANLCLLVQQQRLQALGGWEALLASIRRECPHLDQRLGGPLGEAAGAVGDSLRLRLRRCGRYRATGRPGGGDSVLFRRRNLDRAAQRPGPRRSLPSMAAPATFSAGCATSCAAR